MRGSDQEACCPQNLSIALWSFAALAVLAWPLMTAISAASLRRICEFSPQCMANTAWALATCAFLHSPCLDAIAREAMRGMPDFAPQNLSNTVWAFSALRVGHAPLLPALAAACRRAVGGGPRPAPRRTLRTRHGRLPSCSFGTALCMLRYPRRPDA